MSTDDPYLDGSRLRVHYRNGTTKEGRVDCHRPDGLLRMIRSDTDIPSVFFLDLADVEKIEVLELPPEA